MEAGGPQVSKKKTEHFLSGILSGPMLLFSTLWMHKQNHQNILIKLLIHKKITAHC